jgi:PPK2 family polyphosphate:nucleotide phosphotransferase
MASSDNGISGNGIKLKPANFAVSDPKKFKLATRSPDRPTDMDKEAAKAATAQLLTRISNSQSILYAQQKRRVLVVIQAMDTGGKDGTLKDVFGPLNPQGVRVVPFKAPTPIELSHDYLWRIHQQVPANGEITVFNRSHYEDVLVVRVHNLVPEERWKMRYAEIAQFEQFLVDEGTTIVKFFLHISKDEQKARLQSRIDDPTKRWKFNPADLEERKFWDDYQAAYQDALAKTSTTDAPWYVVPANSKWYRNLVVATVMADTLDKLKLDYPPDPPGLDKIVID